MTERKLIYHPTSKVLNDTITIYGAGKFSEESLRLDKDRARLVLLELWKFLKL